MHLFHDPLMEAQEAFVQVWKAAGLLPTVPMRFDSLGDGANPPNARISINRSTVDRDAEGAMITWDIKAVVRLKEGDLRRRDIGEHLNRMTQIGVEVLDGGDFKGKQTQVTDDDRQRFGGANLELLAYGWDMSIRTTNTNV